MQNRDNSGRNKTAEKIISRKYSIDLYFKRFTSCIEGCMYCTEQGHTDKQTYIQIKCCFSGTFKSFLFFKYVT